MTSRKLSLAKIHRAYVVFGSARKAARILHLSHNTVVLYLRRAGIKRAPIGGGYRKGLRAPYIETSRVASWYRRHLDTAGALRSPTKIAFAAGTSSNAVRCYLYRRRKYERMATESIVRILGIPRSTRWVVDPYTFEVSFMAGGKVILRATSKEMSDAGKVL